MKEQIQEVLRGIITELCSGELEVIEKMTLHRPKDFAHGDWSFNDCFVLAKSLGKNPVEIASQIVEKFDVEHVSAVTVGPYINFSFDEDFYRNSLSSVIEDGDSYGSSDMYSGKKILVEHTSVNLFKPFNIGHLVSNSIGESIKRLMVASGANVTTISFPSDISLGIAKAVWGLHQKFPGVLADKSISTKEKMIAIGESYVFGTVQNDESEDVKNDIKEIATTLYEKDTNNPYFQTYKLGKDLNIAYFKSLTHRLGSEFDGYIFESEAGVIGKKIVEENTPNVFELSNDATIFAGEKYDLHTRVFINAQGQPTYESKDLGLLHEKFNRYTPDLSLFINDHEQSEYFKVVKKAAGLINPTWEQGTQMIPHGRLGFKGVKISSRLGNAPLAETVLDTIVTTTEEKIAENENSRGSVDVDSIAIGAIKFAILKNSLGKNMTFDQEQSLSFEGDSGPYLQYTHARCRSIIKKASEANIIASTDTFDADSLEVVRRVEMYGETVERAIVERSPHYIVAYLLDLVHAYNSYYNDHQIIDESDLEMSAYRVQLTEAVAITLKNGLYLLGINAPDEM